MVVPREIDEKGRSDVDEYCSGKEGVIHPVPLMGEY